MRKTGRSGPYQRPLEIHGIDGIIANIYASNERVGRRIRNRNRRTARKMRNTAKAYCPVDRGYLRASITDELSRDELAFRVFCDPQVFAAIPTGPEEPYDIWVEFGTSVAPAQPFMTPAYLEHIGEYKAGIRRDVQMAIRADARKR